MAAGGAGGGAAGGGGSTGAGTGGGGNISTDLAAGKAPGSSNATKDGSQNAGGKLGKISSGEGGRPKHWQPQNKIEKTGLGSDKSKDRKGLRGKKDRVNEEVVKQAANYFSGGTPMVGEAAGAIYAKTQRAKRKAMKIWALIFLAITLIFFMVIGGGTITGLITPKKAAAEGPVGSIVDINDADLQAVSTASGIPLIALDAYIRDSALLTTRITPESAAAHCRMRWQILAGIADNESGHGTNKANPSPYFKTAGDRGDTIGTISGGGNDPAVGVFQMRDSTFNGYAKKENVDGDNNGKLNPNNVYDEGMAAAFMICSNAHPDGRDFGASTPKSDADFLYAVKRYCLPSDPEGCPYDMSSRVTSAKAYDKWSLCGVPAKDDPGSQCTPTPCALVSDVNAGCSIRVVYASFGNATGARATIIQLAMAQQGKPYVFNTPGNMGLSNPNPPTFDCSGLTGWVYARVGIKLAHYTNTDYRLGTPISIAEMQPGDLVYFRHFGSSDIHHVGIYLGNNQYIHAPHTGDHVRIADLGGRIGREDVLPARYLP